jgi:hypothetical protein
VQDSGSVKYRKQQSTPFRITESPNIFPEFLYSVMDRNLAISQQRLESKLARLRKTTRLRESQPLLLEQRQGKFSFKLGLAHVSRRENFI